MTQNECILKHLENGETLTPLLALQMCGTLRLSERVREIEQSGVPIEHEFVKVGGKRVMGYTKMRFNYG